MQKVAVIELQSRLDRDARSLILDNPCETTRPLELLAPDLFAQDEDPEIVETGRRGEIRYSAGDLLFVEEARDRPPAGYSRD